MRYFLFFLPLTAGLRREQSAQSALATLVAVQNDTRLPFPKELDFSRLYCFGDSLPVAPIRAAARLAVEGSLVEEAGCGSHGDCVENGFKKFCISGQCRECRYASDCGNPDLVFCSSDTDFTCAECADDSGCENSAKKVCRFVKDLNLGARKRCVDCPHVPVSGLLDSTSACAWSCRGNSMVGTEGDCEPCPMCGQSEMLIPASEFSLATPTSFFPTCYGSTNPKCVKCPGSDNECATQLTPTLNWEGRTDVGFLPQEFPCRAFTCKQDWFLDKDLNQCRKCDYRACGIGKFLSGCNQASPGECIECPIQTGVAEGTPFIDPQDLRYPVTSPLDVCKPSCPANTRLFRALPSYPWTCATCELANSCPIGFFFSGCGPDESSGSCSECASQPPAGSFWAPNCKVNVCDPTACKPGTLLVGCGGSSAGRCEPCPNELPTNAFRYEARFDEVTMTTTTCGVKCGDGFFRTSPDGGLTEECTPCDPSVCGLGKRLTGCGGTERGICTDCPPIGKTDFFTPSSSSVCSSLACASQKCPPGQLRSGCGRLSAGECVSCGDLPAGATGWSTGCDVDCKSGFYKGGTGLCIACSSSACSLGQRLENCGGLNPGSCTSCPAIPDSAYWVPNPSSPCTSELCSNRKCPPSQFAKNCGQSKPGDCTSCPDLPVNATGWSVANNACTAQCGSQFFADAAGACIPCDLGMCAVGFVLAGCGGTQLGHCVPCNPLADPSLCFLSHGNLVDDKTSCPTTTCST